MFRSSMFLLLAFGLAACASPRDACLREATAQPRLIQAQIIETELALSRGYRLVTLRDRSVGLSTCIGRRSDGRTFGYGCYRPVSQTRQEPVAIDYSEERAKLARLRDAYEAATERSQRLVQFCPVPIAPA